VIAYRLALSDEVNIQKIVTIGAVCNQTCAEWNEKFFEDVTHEDYITGFARNFDFYKKNNPQPDTHKFIKAVERMWFDKSENGYPNIDIQTINIPTLIVRGNDDFDTLESYVEMIPKIPNSILFNVPFEGHVPTFEKYPQFFAEVVKDFFTNDNKAEN